MYFTAVLVKAIFMEELTKQNSYSKPGEYFYKSYTMILTVYNEEARVKRVIDYYRPFAKMIVVDNFSTDNTTSIVKSLGVELVQYKNPGTAQTPECIKYFISLVDTDYILFLSCSEFMPARLFELFDKVASEKTYDVVSCVRDSYTCGELIPLWGGRFKWIDARVDRFINKHGIDPDKIVIHGKNTPLNKERVLHLPRDKNHVIIHLRDADAISLIKKSVDYAAVEAEHRAKRGMPVTGFKLLYLLVREVVRFLHLPPAKWNRIALREIWARMIMHSITYWIGWELRNEKTIKYSQRQNEHLWQELIADQYGQTPEKQQHDE
jgi:glycosyltransferase involved in cell wall biosynthesis